MNPLVDHARRELNVIKENPESAQAYLEIVETFSRMGHSGGSASVAISIITGLLSMQNLSPLTDDAAEWFHHHDDLWQNTRNGEAFSHDGGKTYYLLSEGAHDMNRMPLHTSRSKSHLRLVLEADV